jgi:hypothetical protein
LKDSATTAASTASDTIRSGQLSLKEREDNNAHHMSGRNNVESSTNSDNSITGDGDAATVPGTGALAMLASEGPNLAKKETDEWDDWD